MAERNAHDELPQARVTPGRRTRISVIWTIPILAAVVALGIAVNRIMKEGPTITIEFRDAGGIEAGKTFIKYKDVNIGQVTRVELSDDFSKVKVTAKVAKHAEGLIVGDATFWVVQPQVTLRGVSGLGTLLSGDYIGFGAGQSKKPRRAFVGLDVPPVIADQPGREFNLTASALGSLGIGSPVYFRRIPAGQVTAFELAPDGKAVTFKVYVNSPYDRFVVPETRFWNASGIDVSVGANGIDVRTESLVSLIAGGIAFETPAFALPASPAAAGSAFTLYANRTTAMRQPDAIARRFVLYFDESLHGVSVGAPVLFLGLPAGEIEHVSLEVNPKAPRPRGKVEIVAYPERVVMLLKGEDAAEAAAIVRTDVEREAMIERLVEQQGMRAQLRSGNLLTGERYVALDFFPDATKATVDWSARKPVLPTIPSTLPEMQAKLESILVKLDRIPYEKVGNDLANTLESTNKLLARFDTELTPEIKSTLVELRSALAKADRLMQNADTNLTGPDAPTQQALRQALQEISAAARSLRELTDYLERHPDALLRGKDEETK